MYIVYSEQAKSDLLEKHLVTGTNSVLSLRHCPSSFYSWADHYFGLA